MGSGTSSAVGGASSSGASSSGPVASSGAAPSSSAAGLPAGTFYVFATQAQSNGDLARYSGFSGAQGVFAADFICQQDHRPGVPAGTYKAFIVDGVLRTALDADGGMSTNWVMKANTTYMRSTADGGFTVAAITDAQGLVRTDGGLVNTLEFEEPGNPGSFHGGNLNVWTGLDADYHVTETCGAWIQSVTTGTGGGVARLGVSGSGLLGLLPLHCNELARLLCVQQ